VEKRAEEFLPRSEGSLVVAVGEGRGQGEIEKNFLKITDFRDLVRRTIGNMLEKGETRDRNNLDNY
jgi:hypothetical protein